MAIELKDIRTAVRVYLNTKVAVSISPLVADVPGVISPNEGFTFSVTAINAASTEGGIALRNIRYHLSVANSSVAKLVVPPTTVAITRAIPAVPVAGTTDITLTPGTQVKEMFLFPLADRTLTTGDTDTISGLKGRAGALGNTEINFDILADPDLEFLFPKNENSFTTSRPLSVV